MNGSPQQPLVVYVDVDDTLIRTVGTKRIPITAAIDHVRSLYAQGARLFCWSSGCGDYARTVTEEIRIADCFVAFLPKPQVMLGDQPASNWRRLVTIHPAECESESVVTYRDRIQRGR